MNSKRNITSLRAASLPESLNRIIKRTLLYSVIVSALPHTLLADEKPNIIFMMADDLGIAHIETYGFDDGIPGQIKTPGLNAMAKNGLRFDRFYSQAPVCSPTRASCYTGRHPYRIGIWEANQGHLRSEEITLPEVLKEHGYTVGHFGKWHMGLMVQDDPRLAKKAKRMPYSSPESNGVDDWFAIHFAPSLYNPFSDGLPGAEETDNPFYENGKRVTSNVDGDTSRIIIDRAIPFIRNAAENDKPFVAYIWFNTPHTPLSADPKYEDIYKNWELYGPITDMDTQVARLREELRNLKIEENTMLWFSSDNGPASGSAGPYFQGKRHLFEGGIRVPTILEWPEKIEANTTTDIAACTSDYFLTSLSAADIDYSSPYPMDGENILPLILKTNTTRNKPLFFQSHGTSVIMEHEYKLMRVKTGAPSAKPAEKRGFPLDEWILFDLKNDPGETTNIAGQHPEKVHQMKKQFEAWDLSCKDSYIGSDYPEGIGSSYSELVYINDREE